MKIQQTLQEFETRKLKNYKFRVLVCGEKCGLSSYQIPNLFGKDEAGKLADACEGFWVSCQLLGEKWEAI